MPQLLKNLISDHHVAPGCQQTPEMHRLAQGEMEESVLYGHCHLLPLGVRQAQYGLFYAGVTVPGLLLTCAQACGFYKLVSRALRHICAIL